MAEKLEKVEALRLDAEFIRMAESLRKQEPDTTALVETATSSRTPQGRGALLTQPIKLSYLCATSFSASATNLEG